MSSPAEREEVSVEMKLRRAEMPKRLMSPIRPMSLIWDSTRDGKDRGEDGGGGTEATGATATGGGGPGRTWGESWSRAGMETVSGAWAGVISAI